MDIEKMDLVDLSQLKMVWQLDGLELMEKM